MIGSRVGACPEYNSSCYALQVSFATPSAATVRDVDAADKVLWRIERLKAAVQKMDGGNVTAFGKRLNYLNGAHVRQMLTGTRPISEKTIEKIHALPGLDGWFDPSSESELSQVIAQLKTEIANREIPEHVLLTTLQMFRGFPLRVRAA